MAGVLVDIKLKDRSASGLRAELGSVVVRIERPDPVEIPRLDLSFFGTAADKVQSLYCDLIVWLERPYVYDTFESHDERRAWRAALEQRYDERLLKGELADFLGNKFRMNNVMAAVTAARAIQESLQACGPDFAELCHAISTAINPDNTLKNIKAAHSIPERRLAIEELERKVLNVMCLLSEFSTGHTR